MAHDARAIANCIIQLAWNERLPLTHLSLQKILFFAHAWHLAKFDQALIGQGFEAWQYGPVVRVVYDQLKSNKAKPIERKLVRLDIETGAWVEASALLTELEADFLTKLYHYYSKYDASVLVDLTHEAGGPWEKIWTKAVENVVPGMGISDDEIKSWMLRGGGRGAKIAH